MIEDFLDAYVKFAAIKLLDDAFSDPDYLCNLQPSFEEVKYDFENQFPIDSNGVDIERIVGRIEDSILDIMTGYGLEDNDGQLSFNGDRPSSDIAKAVYGEFLQAQSALADFSYDSSATTIVIRHELPTCADGEVFDESNDIATGFASRNILFSLGEELEFAEEINRRISEYHDYLLGKYQL